MPPVKKPKVEQMPIESDDDPSSDEEDYSDDEWLHFEQRFDPVEDTVTKKRANDCDPPAAKKAKTESWKAENESDETPASLKFSPARKPGPQLSSLDSHSPLSLFKLFFSESTVSTLCDNTNAQAARAMTKGRKYRWVDVCVSEFYRYIGLTFYMATVKMGSIHDYWRQDSLFSVPFPARVLSRDRYRTISWNVHLSCPDADAENDGKRGTAQHDNLFRLKPLMDTIRLACKSFYHPRRNLVVNERLVPTKENTGMRRYVKPKPKRLGFKVFVLTDSSNGYTVNFSVYTGKKTFPAEHGLSYYAVMSLLECKFLGTGYHIYMDDFYTSPKLLNDMLALKFGACGAYRDYRMNLPQNTSNALSAQSNRGSIRWIRNGPVVCVKWMDQEEVSVCSTIHAAYTGDRTKRKVKIQGKWKTRVFPCPAPVTAYKQHIGGGDLSDELLQDYTAQHKTVKWYRKVFLHFLDIAASNAFVLHKEMVGNLSGKEFMEQLIAELCDVPRKATPPKHSGVEHVPVPAADLSSCDTKRVAGIGRRTCVRCRKVNSMRKETPWKCQACDVYLCLQLQRNCFQEWHKSQAVKSPVKK